MPVALDITAPYTAAEAWFYDRYIAPAVLEAAARIEAEILPLAPPGARVLDVGCGGGHVALRAAARRPDLRVAGLDLSMGQVRRGARRARAAAARAAFVRGSALDLPFASASLDAVLSVASIKHWPDPRRGLRECVRVLRPGGALLVAEADRGCKLADAREFVRRFRFPLALAPVALALFRTYVAGQAPEVEEARAWLVDLALRDGEVRRVPGAPAWILVGSAS